MSDVDTSGKPDLIATIELPPFWVGGDVLTEGEIHHLRKLGFSIRIMPDLSRELTPPFVILNHNNGTAVVCQWLAKERAYPKAGPISGGER